MKKILLSLTAILILSIGAVALVNQVVNGGFEQDFAGWTTAGMVSIETSDVIAQLVGPTLVFDPHNGAKMAKLGDEDTHDAGGPLSNSVSQDINVDGQNAQLSFWYNFVTYSRKPFSGLFVRVNGLSIFNITADSAPPYTLPFCSAALPTQRIGDCKYVSEWTHFSTDLSHFGANPTVELVFFGGDDPVSNPSTWIYIDDVELTAEPAFVGPTCNGDQSLPRRIHPSEREAHLKIKAKADCDGIHITASNSGSKIATTHTEIILILPAGMSSDQFLLDGELGREAAAVVKGEIVSVVVWNTDPLGPGENSSHLITFGGDPNSLTDKKIVVGMYAEQLTDAGLSRAHKSWAYNCADDLYSANFGNFGEPSAEGRDFVESSSGPNGVQKRIKSTDLIC